MGEGGGGWFSGSQPVGGSRLAGKELRALRAWGPRTLTLTWGHPGEFTGPGLKSPQQAVAVAAVGAAVS